MINGSDKKQGQRVVRMPAWLHKGGNSKYLNVLCVFVWVHRLQ